MKEQMMEVLSNIRHTLKTSKNPADMQLAEVIMVDAIELLIDTNPTKAKEILEQWDGRGYENYVTDGQLKEFMAKHAPKWSADAILTFAKENEFPTHKDGKFNENALVLAMNVEYKNHYDMFIAKYAKTNAEVAKMAYDLGVSSLSQPNFVAKYVG